MICIDGRATERTNPDLMDALRHSAEEFHLTGSRFFGAGMTNPNSDWDFFVLYTEETLRRLKDLGFRALGSGECEDLDDGGWYKDSLTTIVMRAPYQKTHIDVQMVTDVDLKLNAQRLLKIMCLIKPGQNKQTRKTFWNRAILYLKAHGYYNV